MQYRLEWTSAAEGGGEDRGVTGDQILWVRGNSSSHLTRKRGNVYIFTQRERENGSSNLTRKRRNVYTLTQRENGSSHLTRKRGNVYAITEREREK